MSTDKQRRAEIIEKGQVNKDLRAAEQEVGRSAEWKRDASKAARVNPSKLASDGSVSVPEFVTRGFYINKAFVCQDCGKHE